MLTADDLQLDSPEFVFFWNGPFSQWYYSPFEANNIVFETAEQWMMSQKALLFNDQDVFKQIMDAKSPAECKSLGKKISNFDKSIWLQKRLQIVTRGNILKFEQNDNLKQKLLESDGRIIVEASPYDKIWGIGMGISDIKIHNPMNWKGLNLLGIALMTTRYILMKKEQGNL